MSQEYMHVPVLCHKVYFLTCIGENIFFRHGGWLGENQTQDLPSTVTGWELNSGLDIKTVQRTNHWATPYPPCKCTCQVSSKCVSIKLELQVPWEIVVGQITIGSTPFWLLNHTRQLWPGHRYSDSRYTWLGILYILLLPVEKPTSSCFFFFLSL